MIEHLDLLAFENGYVDELARVLCTAVFDYKQAGINHLENETGDRECAGGSPDVEFISIAPHAQMDPGTFDRRRHARQAFRAERQAVLENERQARLRRSKICQ